MMAERVGELGKEKNMVYLGMEPGNQMMELQQERGRQEK